MAEKSIVFSDDCVRIITDAFVKIGLTVSLQIVIDGGKLGLKTKEIHTLKTHRIGIGMRFKILFPVIMVNIVIAALLSALVLHEFEEQCTETAAQGALTIVTLAEARIDGSTLKSLGIDGADSTSYTLVYNSIESIVDSINNERRE